jgi:branched-chain amino acid transport system permease protein
MADSAPEKVTETILVSSQSAVVDPEIARRRRRTRITVALVLLALVTLLPFYRSLGSYNYVLQVGVSIFMWMALASSWNILGGYTGYISLGHNVFFGVGAYFSALVLIHYGVSPFVSAVGAGIVALLLGLLAGLVTFRTQGPAFIISTIALLFIVLVWFDTWSLTGGSNGLSLPVPPFSREWLRVPFYYAMLLAALLAMLLSHRVQHSKFGLALRAIGADQVKAEVAGINTRLFKVLAFALSAFVPGIVGALFAYSISYVRPTIFFLIAVGAEMVLMSIIGGRGTVAGPVIGAALIVLLNEASLTYFGATELNLVITGGLLVVVLLFFPAGSSAPSANGDGSPLSSIGTDRSGCRHCVLGEALDRLTHHRFCVGHTGPPFEGDGSLGDQHPHAVDRPETTTDRRRQQVGDGRDIHEVEYPGMSR